MAAFEERAHVLDGAAVGVVGGETFDAGSPAAMDVVLETGARVVARQVDAARGDAEVAMDEVHQAMRQVAGEVGAEVGAAVLAQPPRDVYPREALFGELDVGVRLVVAQEDVVAGLALLDEVVLERQRLLLVLDRDVVDGAGFREQTAGLGVGELLFEEVAADAVAQALGLADVDDPATSVFVEVDAGGRWQRGGTRLELFEMGEGGHAVA